MTGDDAPRTWAADTAAISRWFLIDVYAKTNGLETLILRRVLGWDVSNLPDWVKAREGTNVRVTVAEIEKGPQWSNSATGTGLVLQGIEIRRLEPRMDSFLEEEPAADHWGLHLPCVTYEVWCPDQTYETAREAWLSLPRDLLDEISKSGLLPRHVQSADAVGGVGYAGSTFIHAPQVRPFCPDLHKVVLPGGLEAWGTLTVVSCILDGTVELGTVHGALSFEEVRALDTTERLAYLTIHCPPKAFADLNRQHEDTEASFIARLPRQAIVGAGADVDLLLIPQKGPPCRIKWGLIKTIGFTLKAFTGPQTKPMVSKHLVRLAKEPWVERVPQFGHSIPADVRHVPPGNPTKVFDILSNAGETLLVCDPYATGEHLAKVLSGAKKCQLLTRRESSEALGEEWCRQNKVEVRIISDDVGGVHDRFILGNHRGYILGTSLNGLGKRHSFIVEADNKMRWVLREVFEALWDEAPVPRAAAAKAEAKPVKEAVS